MDVDTTSLKHRMPIGNITLTFCMSELYVFNINNNKKKKKRRGKKKKKKDGCKGRRGPLKKKIFHNVDPA